jgi:uncharacterized protein with PIN domain
VKFWDTSALVPLLVDEEPTTEVRQIFVRDPDVIIWLLTSVELLSAVGRLGRRAAGIDDLVPGLRSEAVELVSRCVIVSEVEIEDEDLHPA